MSTTSIAPNPGVETIQHLRRVFDLKQNQLNGKRQNAWPLFQEKAMARAEQLRFPTRRDEDWKYTSVQPILNEEWQLATAPALDQLPADLPLFSDIRLVFVDGQLDAALSQTQNLPSGLQIMDMDAVFSASAVSPRVEELTTNIVNTTNPFIALNHAFANSGVFFQVDKNSQIEVPVQIIHLLTEKSSGSMLHPLTLVNAEMGSSLTIIEGFYSLAENTSGWINSYQRAWVAPNAEVKHHLLQTAASDTIFITNTVADQQRDSRYTHTQIDLGAKLVRNNLDIELQGSNTDTNMFGTYVGNHRQHIDNQSFIDHAVPHCLSNELYKGVVGGRATGVFNGKVLVRQDAQKTNAYQTNATLLLSDTATMDAKPQLEIYADDVRCSHGATIGQLDETAVFYLRSRGIREAEARKMLQLAFLEEVIDGITQEDAREHFEAAIQAALTNIQTPA